MTSPEEPVPTPRYAQILAAANKIARDRGKQHVGVDHLFLAIIRDRAAMPTQVLAQLVDLDQVEARLQAVMDSAGYNTPSRRTMPPEEG
jgi:ATP-dependent Clp protease ATP-binding subunit ClpA